VVKAASDEHARLLAMHRETTRELMVAHQAFEHAVEQDRREYADALAAGGKDPGTKNADAAEKRVAQIKRKIEALELAVTEAHAAVTEAVLDERDVLLRGVHKEVDEAATAYRDALDLLTAAHARLSGAVSTRAWLTRFPESTSIPSSLRLVRALPRSNGDLYDARPSSPRCAMSPTSPLPSSTPTARWQTDCTSSNADPHRMTDLVDGSAHNAQR
jgi:hypothetical protein